MDENLATKVSPQDRPETARVYRQLLPLIAKVGVGNRMPGQRELCRRLRSNNNTVTEAMRWLIADGVITRRPRSGTIVVDTARAASGFVVGVITAPRSEVCPFVCILQQFVHNELAELGCSVYWSCPASPHTLAGVLTGRLPLHVLRRGHTDALVSVTGFDPGNSRAAWANELRSIHLGSREDVICGAVIDQGDWVRDACLRLRAAGSSRPALILSSGGPERHRRAVEAFAQFTEHGAVLCQPRFPLRGDARAASAGGVALAGQIAAASCDSRPDALIVVDDHAAAGIAATLAAVGIRPLLAIQGNLEAPVTTALPAFRYQVSLEELAAKAAALALSVLRRPDLPPRTEWLKPTLHSDVPTCVVAE